MAVLRTNNQVPDHVFVFASIGALLCMVVAVLGIKLRWFRHRLTFEGLPTAPDRSSSSDNVVMVTGVYRKSQDIDHFVEVQRPKTLPPVKNNYPTAGIRHHPRHPHIFNRENGANSDVASDSFEDDSRPPLPVSPPPQFDERINNNIIVPSKNLDYLPSSTKAQLKIVTPPVIEQKPQNQIPKKQKAPPAPKVPESTIKIPEPESQPKLPTVPSPPSYKAHQEHKQQQEQQQNIEVTTASSTKGFLGLMKTDKIKKENKPKAQKVRVLKQKHKDKNNGVLQGIKTPPQSVPVSPIVTPKVKDDISKMEVIKKPNKPRPAILSDDGNSIIVPTLPTIPTVPARTITTPDIIPDSQSNKVAPIPRTANIDYRYDPPSYSYNDPIKIVPSSRDHNTFGNNQKVVLQLEGFDDGTSEPQSSSPLFAKVKPMKKVAPQPLKQPTSKTKQLQFAASEEIIDDDPEDYDSWDMVAKHRKSITQTMSNQPKNGSTNVVINQGLNNNAAALLLDRPKTLREMQNKQRNQQQQRDAKGTNISNGKASDESDTEV